IEDGPGVSISRFGGFNSPMVCVMTFASCCAGIDSPAGGWGGATDNLDGAAFGHPSLGGATYNYQTMGVVEGGVLRRTRSKNLPSNTSAQARTEPSGSK